MLEADTATAFRLMFAAISERLQAAEHEQRAAEYVERLKQKKT